jgi:hypothetical protein
MSDFLEKSYVKPLLDKEYIKVDKMSIPDGIYYKLGGGYKISLHERLDPSNSGLDYVFYDIITNDGIRGSWIGRETITIKDGLPIGENVYCIMSCHKADFRDKKIDEIIN